MRNKTFGDRIADVLIEDGLLLPNQLEEATAIQKQKGGRLLKILTDKQFVTDQDMAFSMGRCLTCRRSIWRGSGFPRKSWG